MINYNMTPEEINSFACSGHEFLTFDEYPNIVKWYRDNRYAAENVRDFATSAGIAFNVWTRSIHCTYHRHVFMREFKNDLTLSFDVPHLRRNASFPLLVSLHDADGVYFECEMELAIERFVNGRFRLSGWNREPAIREFLIKECADRTSCDPGWIPLIEN